MNYRQINAIRNSFNAIRKYRNRNTEYGNQSALEEAYWLSGYLYALWQADLISEKTQMAIDKIASSLSISGKTKTDKAA